jgi:hypothetical protein
LTAAVLCAVPALAAGARGMRRGTGGTSRGGRAGHADPWRGRAVLDGYLRGGEAMPRQLTALGDVPALAALAADP